LISTTSSNETFRKKLREVLQGGGRNAERAECRTHFRAECRQSGILNDGMPTGTARFRAECRNQFLAEMKACSGGQ